MQKIVLVGSHKNQVIRPETSDLDDLELPLQGLVPDQLLKKVFPNSTFLEKSFLQKEELVRNKRGTTHLLKSAPDRRFSDLDANIAPLQGRAEGKASSN